MTVPCCAAATSANKSTLISAQSSTKLKCGVSDRKYGDRGIFQIKNYFLTACS